MDRTIPRVPMPDPRPSLLLTRPEPASRRFAAAFRARFGADWPVTISPLMAIAALAPRVSAADAVIFTSENAVAPFVALSPATGRLAWCVGDRTAQAAAAAGFRTRAGPGDAARLVPMIVAGHEGGRLIHARGHHIAADIVTELARAGLNAVDAVVYEQCDLALDAAAQALLAGPSPVLVPLFSPRSAALFAQQARDARAPLLLAPISAAAARPCSGLNARVEIAREPAAGAVLDALGRLIASVDAG